ncbi:MAG: hypothetical protein U0610_20915 [bacterium]
MWQPHAANTHPETHPTYQTQLGRLALLRDPNPCGREHPVRGQPRNADDPKTRAREAYIDAQRPTVALEHEEALSAKGGGSGRGPRLPPAGTAFAPTAAGLASASAVFG